MKMKFHASCKQFPELPQDQLAALAADIALHGLKFPILTFNGVIIDGRNRYLACLKAGVEPRYQEIARNDTDPESFVRSMNVFRRHLSVNERAMLAGKLVNSTKGRKASDGSTDPCLTTAAAAKLFKVSAGSVKRAKAISKKGTPKLQKSVETGKVKLDRGAKIANLPKKQQAAALVEPEKKAPRGGLYAAKLEAQRLADQIATEAKEQATKEQKKNGVIHEMPATVEAFVKMKRRELAGAVQARWPSGDYDDVTTVGDMVKIFLEIAEKVLG